MQKKQDDVLLEKFYKATQENFESNESWGEGPWLTEPGLFDMVPVSYKGYECVLTRNHGGAWCGYVPVPKTSKWTLEDNYETIDTHGGITWHDDRLPWEETSEYFWIGFDCAHYNDWMPRHEKILQQTYDLFGDSGSDKIKQKMKEIHDLMIKIDSKVAEEYYKRPYRTLEYATDIIKHMVDQIEENNGQ